MDDDDLYQVTIARYGTRDTVRSDVFLNFPVYREDDSPIVMDYFIWVVRNATRTIVIDTGFSRAGGDRRGRNTVVAPTEIWKALGIEASSAPDVIITHGHFDHVGNVDHFPQSRILMARDEWEFWNSEIARRPLFHHVIDDEDLAVLARADNEGRLELFQESLDLAPGIRVIKVGGHTPGQSIVLVDTKAGTVLLASDALHYYEEFERSMPYIAAADLVEMYAGFETIRGMLADGTADHLVSGHDPSTLERFTPGTGTLAASTATIG